MHCSATPSQTEASRQKRPQAFLSFDHFWESIATTINSWDLISGVETFGSSDMSNAYSNEGYFGRVSYNTAILTALITRR